MKRELFSFSSFLSLLLSVLLLAPTFWVGAAANATVTVSEEKTLVYVSQNGSDASDGTKETPFLTLAAAVRADIAEAYRTETTRQEKENAEGGKQA